MTTRTLKEDEISYFSNRILRIEMMLQKPDVSLDRVRHELKNVRMELRQYEIKF